MMTISTPATPATHISPPSMSRIRTIDSVSQDGWPGWRSAVLAASALAALTRQQHRAPHQRVWNLALVAPAAAATFDVSQRILQGNAALDSAELRRVTQRILARTVTHLGVDRLLTALLRRGDPVITIREQQPLLGVKDNDRRRRIEVLGVSPHALADQVRGPISAGADEHVGDPQCQHTPHRAT